VEKKSNLGKVGWGLSLLFVFLTFIHSNAYADWKKVSPPAVSTDWELRSVHLVSTAQGWAVGEDHTNHRGVLLRFSGTSWIPLNLPAVSADWGLWGIHFTSSGDGWAVGEDYASKKGILLHFVSGTWTSVQPPSVSLNWGLRGIHFVSSTEGWAVGKDTTNKRGVLLHFQSGIWSSVIPPGVSSDWELSSVHFVSSSDGWAVGRDSSSQSGTLIRFSGGSWTFINPPHISSNWDLSSVHFNSSGDGWAAGRDIFAKKGTILHFSGGSWAPGVIPDSPSSEWLLGGISFVASGEGWAVGKDVSGNAGIILHFSSADGTGKWESVTPPSDVGSDWELAALHFVSDESGWAVGRSAGKGVLLRYGVPHISVSPTKIDYHEVSVGASLKKTLTIRNTGKGDLLIEPVFPPSLPFEIETDACSDKVLAPGLSCKVGYKFAPTSGGNFVGSSTIHSNAPDREELIFGLSGIGVEGPPLYIRLEDPPDDQQFTTCSLYAPPPTLRWTPSETFKSILLQFSSGDDFSTTPVTVRGSVDVNEIVIKAPAWKKVLFVPGSEDPAEDGIVYWRALGTRFDKTLVKSDIFSINVKAAAPVLDPAISHTSRTELPPPTLSWENNCNVKFKAWFGNDADFTKRGMKRKSLSFTVKNPNDNGGGLAAPLTESQWQSIRKLAGDVSGATVYWYVESWDGLKNRTVTDVGSFDLTD
jgi:hypothetical protein